MKPKTIVKTASGKWGVVISDTFRICTEDETLVVLDGTDIAIGYDIETLEVVGEEKAVADLKKCGAGRGEDACIFLTIGGDGPECARFGMLRDRLIFADMTAKRHPKQLFPYCQFEG